MENFREKLKVDNLVNILCCAVLAVFSMLAAAGEAGIVPFFAPVAGDEHWQSMWRGFISGAACGIMGVLLFFTIRNALALRKEEKLKKLYVQENDERTILIWASARVAAYRTFLIVGMVAALIAGYFSITVSITVLACILFASILGAVFAAYYSIKI